MPESIDWPRSHSPRGGRRFFLILAGLVLIVVFGFRTAFSYYIDALWFGSLGYGDVFWKKQGVQWTAFAVFALATFLVLFGAFWALKRAYFKDLPGSRTILIG